MGQRIVELVGSGDVALFIATPGQLNIQPRIDGLHGGDQEVRRGKIKTTSTATGALLPDELAKVESYYFGAQEPEGHVRGRRRHDAGHRSTVAKYKPAMKGMKAGGYDLTPTTLKSVNAGHLDFTIDQQPYLQGWIPVLQLFFYKYSSGLVAPSDTNTGIVFVTKANVKPYLTTKTRYEGSSSTQKYPVSNG